MIEQRSPEWYAQRCGKVTASRIADLMAKTRSGYGASRANYMAEILVERLTGQPTPSYANAAMQWGVDHEADAVAAYEFVTGAETAPVGFVPHPDIPDAGASPDRLGGINWLVEVKCPATATHLDYLLTGMVPDKYIKQMQWQMACTGRMYCDFVSFDPRLPPNLQLFIKGVKRSNTVITRIENEVRQFLTEVADKLAALEKL